MGRRRSSNLFVSRSVIIAIVFDDTTMLRKALIVYWLSIPAISGNLS